MIYGPLLTLNGDFIVSKKPLENLNARRNSFINFILKLFVVFKIFTKSLNQLSNNKYYVHKGLKRDKNITV